MDYEAAVKPLCGRAVEIRIEDASGGSEPLAPPRVCELVRVKLVPERTHLKCYINITQHLSIPVFPDENTKLEIDGAEGTRLISRDREAQLLYTLRWL